MLKKLYQFPTKTQNNNKVTCVNEYLNFLEGNPAITKGKSK